MADTHLTRRRLLQVATGTTGTAIAGCLEGRNDGTVGVSASKPEDAGRAGIPTDRSVVTATSRPFPEFDPQVVHVTVGGTIEWFVETGRHDVTAYHRDDHPPHRTTEGVKAWGSGPLTGPGSTYEHTFEREGVYDYVDTQQVCTSHEAAGNVGRVIVGWPEPSDEPALADPQPELPSQVAKAITQFNELTVPIVEAGP